MFVTATSHSSHLSKTLSSKYWNSSILCSLPVYCQVNVLNPMQEVIILTGKIKLLLCRRDRHAFQWKIWTHREEKAFPQMWSNDSSCFSATETSQTKRYIARKTMDFEHSSKWTKYKKQLSIYFLFYKCITQKMIVLEFCWRINNNCVFDLNMRA